MVHDVLLGNRSQQAGFAGVESASDKLGKIDTTRDRYGPLTIKTYKLSSRVNTPRSTESQITKISFYERENSLHYQMIKFQAWLAKCPGGKNLDANDLRLFMSFRMVVNISAMIHECNVEVLERVCQRLSRGALECWKHGVVPSSSSSTRELHQGKTGGIL